MTEEEYLEYDRTHDGKREFVNGELIDMAGVICDPRCCPCPIWRSGIGPTFLAM